MSILFKSKHNEWRPLNYLHLLDDYKLIPLAAFGQDVPWNISAQVDVLTMPSVKEDDTFSAPAGSRSAEKCNRNQGHIKNSATKVTSIFTKHI